MSFFFSVLSFSFKLREREREWYIKFGSKNKISNFGIVSIPKLLILFFDGVPLENLSSFTG